MDAGTRACVAYVAGCVISGTFSRHVYDKARDLHIQMKGSIKGTVVEVLDNDRNCKFMGTLPTLFDFGKHAGITLEIDDKNFFGRDKKADQLFGGTVEGRTIKLHDYGEACDFHYEL